LHIYHAFGVGLTAFSATLTLWSYLILGNAPLTALGMGLTIVGVSIVMTPLQTVHPSTIRGLLEGSVMTLEALLEELNLSKRGYYVRAGDDRVYLYIPVDVDKGPPSNPSKVTGMMAVDKESRYLVLIPPASEIVKNQEIADMGLEDALKHVLVELTELSDRVDVSAGELLTVKLHSPRAHVSAGRFKNTFGSLEASIIACVTAAVLGPTVIVDELEEKGSKVVMLRVLGLE